jgi:hypothetical protein
MSLLTLVQNAARYCQISAPATLFNNPDPTAIFLLSCAQREGEIIARKPPGGWVSMIQEYVFQTVSIGPLSGSIANSGAGGVAVITGLSSTTGIVAGSFIASGTGVPNNAIVKSVDSSSQVTLTLAATSTGAGSFSFGQSDYTLPSDFQRPIDNTFWDRTRYWQMRGPMNPQEWQLYKSSVIGQASIQRRYRFRQINNTTTLSIDPTPFDNGSMLVFEYVSNAWCKSNANPPALRSAWAADSDLGVVDEFLIQLGVTWRILRRLGMSYSEELDEYSRQIDKAMAHDGGSKMLELTPAENLSLIGPWNLPETGFGPQ